MLFFLSVALPLRSTLFPYTTLFRSCRACNAGRVVGARSTGEEAYVVRVDRLRPARSPCDARQVRQADCADRKSTRLNSSHVRISYAVFCLKKKTGATGSLPRRRRPA